MAYAEPNTEGCHRDVLILSMMVVGPKQYAKANIPKDAATPLVPSTKHTRHMDTKTPELQSTTVHRVRRGLCKNNSMGVGLLRDIRLPKRSMKTPISGTKKKPISISWQSTF
jgi:hypothetical protein